MEAVLELLANLIYVWSFVCVGQCFLGFERRNNRYERIIFVVLTLFTTICGLYVDVWLEVLLHILCIITILGCFFREYKKVLFISYLGITAILSMIGLMVEAVIVEIGSYLQITMTDNQINLIAQLLVLLFIWLIGNYFNQKYPDGLKRLGTWYLLVFAIILFFDSAIITILGHFIVDTLEAERKWVLIIILYLGIVVGILIQIVLLINTLITRNIYKEKDALAQKYLDIQNEHYSYLEKREVETKKFRHDIKNHLMLLEKLMQREDYKGVTKYLADINEKVSTFGNRISVNNGIADAILNKYYDEAAEKEIELKVNGHFPLECSITAYDICTVLSNLLSNAIQAEQEAAGKCVSVDIRYTEELLLLVIENDYVHRLKVENGVYWTTKEDELGHGYGLANVRECVERNGGSMSITTDNQRFKVMLAMRNEQRESI